MTTISNSTKVIDDIDLYAKLLLSVKIGDRKDRPLSPFEVTTLLNRMLEEGHSMEDLSKRLDLKDEMINDFLALQKIPNEFQNAIIFGESRDEGVSFSSAVRITRLKEELDRKILLASAMKNKFTKNEIENIVSLKNRSQITIEDCIEKIKNFRPVIEHNFIYVTGITSECLVKLSHLSQISELSSETILKNIISNYIPSENIISILVKGKRVVFTLDEDGSKKFNRFMSQNKLVLAQVIDFFLKNEKISNENKTN